MDNKELLLAKWYKSIKVKHELVVNKGGETQQVFPLKTYPSDEDVAVALRLIGGYHAEVVTTTTERKPYNLIDAKTEDNYYQYNEELKASPVHILQTDEIRKAVVARMKEDSE